MKEKDRLGMKLSMQKFTSRIVPLNPIGNLPKLRVVRSPASSWRISSPTFAARYMIKKRNGLAER